MRFSYPSSSLLLKALYRQRIDVLLLEMVAQINFRPIKELVITVEGASQLCVARNRYTVCEDANDGRKTALIGTLF